MIKSIQNGQKTMSNKLGKVGAFAGLATGGAYLLKNKADIFTKNIANATELGINNTLKFKARLIGVPAGFVVGLLGAGVILGKTIGAIVDKIQAKKEAKLQDAIAEAEINKINKLVESDEKGGASVAFSGLNHGDGKYIDGMPEEVDFPLFLAEPVIDFEMNGKDTYPRDVDPNLDNNADVAD